MLKHYKEDSCNIKKNKYKMEDSILLSRKVTLETI